MLEYIAEVLVTALFLALLALVFWSVAALVLRFSGVQSTAAQVAVVAVAPALALVALTFPAYLFALLQLVRPNLRTLAQVLTFEAWSGIGLALLMAAVALAGVAAAALLARRHREPVLPAVLLTLGLLLLFLVLTFPLWNQVYACAVGRGFIIDWAC